MFESDQYQLIDFGAGRKLERFGRFVLDRICPAADGMRRRDPTRWKEASARFERTSGIEGRWLPPDALPATWQISHGGIQFELKPTRFGHLGIFPEQAVNWDWLARQSSAQGAPWKLLNLFAYTGGSTLAAASGGAEVVHVDASRSVVAWARRNAAAAGLADAPIRWIQEDARVFVRRELKRGNRYDAVVLDPPSFGHGPKGQVWKLEEDLDPLLESCAALTREGLRFCLLTCHSVGMTPSVLEDRLRSAFDRGSTGRIESAPLELIDPSGRGLPGGALARVVG